MSTPRRQSVVLLVVAVLMGGAGPAAADGSMISVLDDFHSDSVLEVDRTANFQRGSGTAGSDHDGSAVDVLTTLVRAAHPEEGD